LTGSGAGGSLARPMRVSRRLVLFGGLGAAVAACTGPRPVAGVPARVAPGRMALPARLMVPALGLNARIAPVGLDASGEMDVPGSAGEIGWYELGPRPGERGNAVLIGHNVWEGRVGAFGQLGSLRMGDRVTVATSPPAHFTYAVENVKSYPAGSAPTAEIFGPSSDPVLTLITCAGRPDSRGDYPDRLVVRARAAG
jgi:hypothetical protein